MLHHVSSPPSAKADGFRYQNHIFFVYVFGIRNELRKKGEMMGDFDTLIASTAIVHGVKLITSNKGHFTRIKEVEIWKK